MYIIMQLWLKSVSVEKNYVKLRLSVNCLKSTIRHSKHSFVYATVICNTTYITYIVLNFCMITNAKSNSIAFLIAKKREQEHRVELGKHLGNVICIINTSITSQGITLIAQKVHFPRKYLRKVHKQCLQAPMILASCCSWASMILSL